MLVNTLVRSSVPSKHETLTQAGPLLAHCLLCWLGIKPALVQRFVFAGSQSVCKSVSDLFLSRAVYRTGGQTRDIASMLDYCWPTVYDADPTLAK